MTGLVDESIRFFADNFPTTGMLLRGCPAGLLWSTVCLLFAGFLKKRYDLKTGYTRKVFHFLVFGSVIMIHWRLGITGVCVFGGMTSLVIAYAILRGSGHLMYEAMAREKDAPRRTYYIVVPYFATLIGGLLSNMLFPATAVFGYLVTGLGDAVAEPVGTRFGKHRYTVPAFTGVKAVRSVEGSAAVFVVSILALAACCAFSPQFVLAGRTMWVLLLIGFVSTMIEAVSPHGWDNATLQVIPAFMGALLNVTGS